MSKINDKMIQNYIVGDGSKTEVPNLQKTITKISFAQEIVDYPHRVENIMKTQVSKPEFTSPL
jgi:hypothetical protein